MALEVGEAHCCRVELAARSTWPRDPVHHVPELLGIRPLEWETILCSNIDLLTEIGYWPIADYDLDTPYGQRSFQVWQHRSDDRTIIMKEVCPTPLLVLCNLTVSEGSIEATFCLMSGTQFTTCDFVLWRPGAALYLFELEDAARAAALEQDLLESRQQKLELLLHGFNAALPSRTPVWPGGVLTPQALEEHIGRLRALGTAGMDEATGETAARESEEEMESEPEEVSDSDFDI